MSLTTWLDATMVNVCPLGTIDARWNGAVNVVTYNAGSRSTLLGESTNRGRKLALYEVLNNPRVIAQIRTLEAETKAHAERLAMAESDPELALYMGVECSDEYEPTPEDERLAALAVQG